MNENLEKKKEKLGEYCSQKLSEAHRNSPSPAAQFKINKQWNFILAHVKIIFFSYLTISLNYDPISLNSFKKAVRPK